MPGVLVNSEGKILYDPTEGKVLYEPPTPPPTCPSINQQSGLLVVGWKYKILSYVSGDDFTNVGADSNTTGTVFTATGTTPTDWTHFSIIGSIIFVTVSGVTMCGCQGLMGFGSVEAVDGHESVSGPGINSTYEVEPGGAMWQRALNNFVTDDPYFHVVTWTNTDCTGFPGGTLSDAVIDVRCISGLWSVLLGQGGLFFYGEGAATGIDNGSAVDPASGCYAECNFADGCSGVAHGGQAVISMTPP